MSWLSQSPPERIEIDDFVVERANLQHAEALADAVNESLDHLRPWMDWAQEPVSGESYELMVPEWHSNWERRSDFQYIITRKQRVVGGIGVHDRIAPCALEIGYWLHPAATGEGIITRTAERLTAELFEFPEVVRLVIRCDKGNLASAAVPRRLGFQLIRELDQAPVTPGNTGRYLEWELTLRR